MRPPRSPRSRINLPFIRAHEPHLALGIPRAFPFGLTFALAIGMTLVMAASSPQADRATVTPVAPGVVLRQIVSEAPHPPRIVTTVEVDPKRPGIRIGAELGLDVVENDGPTRGREAVSTLARRKGLTAGVNGDFFVGGAPVGLCIRDGELVTLPLLPRATCAVLPGNRVVFDLPKTSASVRVVSRAAPSADATPGAAFPLTSLNRPRPANSLILYSPAYGPRALTNNSGVEAILSVANARLRPGVTVATVTDVRAGQGGTPLQPGQLVLSAHGSAAAFLRALVPGDRLEITLSVTSPRIPDWKAVRDAMGGGPFLARGGRVDVDAKAEKFQYDVVVGRAPRTALGVKRDGTFLLVAVDGRQPLSAGLTLDELARLMLSLGCDSAMNLDGGGSTAMAVRGLRVNSPADGWERSVAQTVAVRATPPPGPPALAPGAPPTFHLLADIPGPLSAGQSVAFELRDEDGEALPPETPALWGVEGPVGFVDQSGYFTARKVGAGRVLAQRGMETTAFPITVVASRTPASVAAIWSPFDPARPDLTTLAVTVRDANGNAIPGLTVDLGLPGTTGTADTLSRPTDETGIARFSVAWAPGAVRRLTVTAGPVTVTSSDAPGGSSPQPPPPAPPSAVP